MYVVIVIVALVVVGPAVCTSHIAAVISVNFWPAHFFRQQRQREAWPGAVIWLLNSRCSPSASSLGCALGKPTH